MADAGPLSSIKIGERGPGRGKYRPENIDEWLVCVDERVPYYMTPATRQRLLNNLKREERRYTRIDQIIQLSWENLRDFFTNRAAAGDDPYEWEETFATLFRHAIWDLSNTDPLEYRQLQSKGHIDSGKKFGEGCKEHYRTRKGTGHYAFAEFMAGRMTRERWGPFIEKAARFHVTTKDENGNCKTFVGRHPEVRNWRIIYFMCGIRLFNFDGEEQVYFREKDKEEAIALGLLDTDGNRQTPS